MMIVTKTISLLLFFRERNNTSNGIRKQVGREPEMAEETHLQHSDAFVFFPLLYIDGKPRSTLFFSSKTTESF